VAICKGYSREVPLLIPCSDPSTVNVTLDHRGIAKTGKVNREGSNIPGAQSTRQTQIGGSSVQSTSHSLHTGSSPTRNGRSPCYRFGGEVSRLRVGNVQMYDTRQRDYSFWQVWHSVTTGSKGFEGSDRHVHRAYRAGYCAASHPSGVRSRKCYYSQRKRGEPRIYAPSSHNFRATTI
jgi:hypothetical protein